MNKTIIRIPSEDSSFELPGTKTENEARNTIGSEIPGLASMSCQTTSENGQTVLTFSPRTGQKGFGMLKAA